MSDGDEDREPVSYETPDGETPTRRRAVFSDGFGALTEHHAASSPSDGETARRRHVRQDDSLRLIDDLTNRPVDPMFSDARLGRGRRSALEVWATRIVVFVVCVAVGFIGCLFIQKLHTDPRRAVRQSLAGQLEAESDHASQLGRDIARLQKQIAERSGSATAGTASERVAEDAMAIGTTAVHGPGVTVTLADPLAASGDVSEGGERVRVITDLDLQRLVNALWSAGAEAVAVNGVRLGIGTSIRAAGGSILVGLEAVGSPYDVSAIGDRSALERSLSDGDGGQLAGELRQGGITVQVHGSRDITLEAAVTGDVRYARKTE